MKQYTYPETHKTGLVQGVDEGRGRKWLSAADVYTGRKGNYLNMDWGLVWISGSLDCWSVWMWNPAHKS